MRRELELRSIPATTQKIGPRRIQRPCFEEPLRFDIPIDDCLPVEVKAVWV